MILPTPNKLVRKFDSPVTRISYVPKEGAHCWLLVCSIVMVLSALRGIRYPSGWTYTYYLFNYDSGFTKRSFLGGVVKYIDIPYLASYEIFALFSIAMLLCNLLLLAMLLRDFVRSGNIFLLCCSIIFVCSVVTPFLSHLVGYGDHVGMFVTLIVLKIRYFWRKLIFALPSFLIALLVHEVNFVFFFPVIFISLLFAIKDNRRMQKFVALISASILLSGFVYVVSSANLTEEEASVMYDTLQAEIEFPLRKDAFDTLHRDAVENFNHVRSDWSGSRRYMPKLVNPLLVVLPVLAACLGTTTFFLFRSYRSRYVIPLATFASLSPLVLNFIARDAYRWFIWSAVTSFFTLYVVSKRYGNSLPSPPPSAVLFPLLILIVFITSITHAKLFDGYHMRPFPFIGHQKHILSSTTKKRGATDEVWSDPNMLSVLTDPIIASDYNVYLKDGRLLYIRDECINIDDSFFLHVFPSDPDQLPESHKAYSFENLDFRFVDHAGEGRFRCVAVRKLPDYDIAAIRTGQDTAEGRLWEATYFFSDSLDSQVRRPAALTSRSGQRNAMED